MLNPFDLQVIYLGQPFKSKHPRNTCAKEYYIPKAAPYGAS
jgi:hypothetical protein